MLLIGLITLLLAISLSSAKFTAQMLTRITTIILLFSAALSYNGLFIPQIGSGLGLYSGLFHVTTVSQSMDAFIFLVGAIILIPVSKSFSYSSWNVEKDIKGVLRCAEQGTINGRFKEIGRSISPTVSEYSLIILFTTTGATLLVSSADLVSMYLAIELQSFAVYILATLYRDSESATSAGLKYFLLGGLSSGFILLGSALIYSYTGLTQFEGLYSIASVAGGDYQGGNGIALGAIIIAIGLLFKVAAAPFHNWGPDVYDGVPTIVTTWLTIMPKLSIFIFLLELHTGIEGNLESFSTLLSDSPYNLYGSSRSLLLVCSLLSLILGTVVGLAQYKIKRLLAYSTISHVGFLLLALAINSEESIESFLFYIVQYSLTTLNSFFILLAFGYLIHSNTPKSEGSDIQYIVQLKGQFLANPLLGISLAVCLFSMAGVPPLIGFFAKQMVLYSATHASTVPFGDGQSGEYLFLSLVAIITSVISAAYYLRIIRVIHFDSITPVNISDNQSAYNNTLTITNAHSFVIALLTLIILLFVVKPSLILNSTHLLALSLFYY